MLCTDTEAEPLRILQWYLLRWQVEVTPYQVRGRLFEELRAHLGMETQRQWSERAIARTTPALFGLFSVVTLAADILIEQRGAMAPRTTAWYDKTSPSFADAIALVRRHLWVQQGTFMPSEREHESIKVPRLLYQQDARHASLCRLIVQSRAFAVDSEKPSDASHEWGRPNVIASVASSKFCVKSSLEPVTVSNPVTIKIPPPLTVELVLDR